ncbi:hypothetical protein AZA_38262 [Nitrospirillum viridazoti Y2]|nr:hypothetical protein AZA_38262 [Nitrospirillum amazonense Y2]
MDEHRDRGSVTGAGAAATDPKWIACGIASGIRPGSVPTRNEQSWAPYGHALPRGQGWAFPGPGAMVSL